jgi:hypothetical protein
MATDAKAVARLASPMRELAPDGVAVSVGDKEYKWSGWHRGLTPESRGTWYKRDDDSLSRDVLPGDRGGVYEIAAVKNDKKRAVIYCGRATKVRKGVPGKTLRQRIYSGYCWDGSHIHGELARFLKTGHEIWFRWIIMDDTDSGVDTVKTMEKHILSLHDYALNVEHNNKRRSLVDTKHDRSDALEEENTRLRAERDHLRIAHLKACAEVAEMRDARKQMMKTIKHLRDAFDKILMGFLCMWILYILMSSMCVCAISCFFDLMRVCV